ncbi:helix-turn-helix transcriptional regulator [Sporosarcina limicola]|uniref:DNA-binding XRE family transcriptional regulator n=1 Tax=Sporosarcina limicola TaxID=34101 RepID=A0A927R8H5_9BACL|nr:helix-turn-helix transcriptional regulator [Sporosarcina limicola]MBE1557009.1 DNA-binding XRE family transcriptional regulator [Sporosarcina limicola]
MMNPLKELRAGNGLTQKEMADKIGVSLSMYEKVERGTIQASRNFIGKIKRAFPHISIDYIFFNHQQHLECLIKVKKP